MSSKWVVTVQRKGCNPVPKEFSDKRKAWTAFMALKAAGARDGVMVSIEPPTK